MQCFFFFSGIHFDHLYVNPVHGIGFELDFSIKDPHGRLYWCVVPRDILNPTIEDCTNETNGYICSGSNF